jgi:hypothetical protein
VSKEPVVTYNSNGDVEMQFEANGHTMIVRLSPDTADHLARQIGHMSIGARKVRADAVKARNNNRMNLGEGITAVDFDAKQWHDSAVVEVLTPGQLDRNREDIERINDARAEAANAIEREDS